MISIQFRVLLFTFLLIPTSILVTETLERSNFSIARTNCTDRCGGINIPFPFGTTQECYRNISFWVTCNQTFSTPKLFVQNSSVEISNISLDGQVTIMPFIANDCYEKNMSLITIRNITSLRLPRLMTVNNTANKFIILGCDTYGSFSGFRRGGRRYFTGCMATCTTLDDLVADSCEGLGCCEISSIPKNVWHVVLHLHSFRNYRNVWRFNHCGYAFFVEKNSFNFSRKTFTNMRNVEKLPMVADWVIGEETCETVQMNSSGYACKGQNAQCYNPGNGYGYRCQCKPGYQGNPYLVDGCQDIDECQFPELSNCTHTCKNYVGTFKCYCRKGYKGNETGSGGCTRGESQTFKIIAGIAVVIIVVMLIMCLLYLERKRRRLNKMKDVYFQQNGGILLQERLKAAGGREMSTNDDDHIAKIFTATELHNATNNFHNSTIIGQGGFGTVYKGFLENKNLVAIKKSKEVDTSQIEQFINEFMVLSRIRHRNVVKLLGCCLETEVPLLVYEFINNGTLYDHLHKQSSKCLLDWKLRLKIAIETADVLAYLHSAASTPIIHRDVKSANILLDSEFNAKVSDFGASRLVPMDQTQVPTMVLGTLGYLDPEYMQSHQLTDKSDVYSFGVVLVELISGKKAITCGRSEEKKSLSSFFLGKLKQGRLCDVLDETIELNECEEQQVTGVAKLAEVCLNMRGEDRPSMREVAMELESLKSGGKRSWAKQKQNSEEIKSLSGKGYDDESFSGKDQAGPSGGT